MPILEIKYHNEDNLPKRPKPGTKFYGEQSRNKRPLKNMPEDWLRKRQAYFLNTPPEDQVHGMELDGKLIGPPLSQGNLESLIPSQRVIENELRYRGILFDGKIVGENKSRGCLVEIFSFIFKNK